ncbi:MAG: hypothetical protein KF803_04925 [Cyclobacteriaceae bacterium]|nr:hypothetical protein [Cyclobacteriaceae bacterium]
MRSILTIFTLMIILLSSCLEERNETTKRCLSVNEALEEIQTLKAIVNSGIVAGRKDCTVYAGAQIYSGIYKGNQVFYFINPASSLAVCGSIAYNCQGEEILNRALNNQGWEDFIVELTGVEQLWVKNP